MTEATQLGRCCFNRLEQQAPDPTSFSVAARYAAPEPTWTMLTNASDSFSRSVVCMTADAVPSSSTLIGSQSQGCPSNEPTLVANSKLAVCSLGQQLGRTPPAGVSDCLASTSADVEARPLNSPPVSVRLTDTPAPGCRPTWYGVRWPICTASRSQGLTAVQMSAVAGVSGEQPCFRPVLEGTPAAIPQ